jgi:hypothetical protein
MYVNKVLEIHLHVILARTDHTHSSMPSGQVQSQRDTVTINLLAADSNDSNDRQLDSTVLPSPAVVCMEFHCGDEDDCLASALWLAIRRLRKSSITVQAIHAVAAHLIEIPYGCCATNDQAIELAEALGYNLEISKHKLDSLPRYLPTRFHPTIHLHREKEENCCFSGYIAEDDVILRALSHFNLNKPHRNLQSLLVELSEAPWWYDV